MNTKQKKALYESIMKSVAKTVKNILNETGSYELYNNERVSLNSLHNHNNHNTYLKEILLEIDELLDLNQRGKKLYKKGVDDLKTDELMTKMSLPEYQCAVILTSKALKLKDVTILKKGTVYSVIQF